MIRREIRWTSEARRDAAAHERDELVGAEAQIGSERLERVDKRRRLEARRDAIAHQGDELLGAEVEVGSERRARRNKRSAFQQHHDAVYAPQLFRCFASHEGLKRRQLLGESPVQGLDDVVKNGVEDGLAGARDERKSLDGRQHLAELSTHCQNSSIGPGGALYAFSGIVFLEGRLISLKRILWKRGGA